LVVSTCFLYLVAAGLVARSVWYFEAQHWKSIAGRDVADLGDGPGSYDIDRSVWHVNVSVFHFTRRICLVLWFSGSLVLWFSGVFFSLLDGGALGEAD
jgi:high-affinity Fe2+/Pb2+ permease